MQLQPYVHASLTEIAAVGTPFLTRRALSVEVLLVVAFSTDFESRKAAPMSVAPITRVERHNIKIVCTIGLRRASDTTS